jgi:hypothetical protein
MLRFNNPPDHVYESPRRVANPLPILYTFDPATGQYLRNGKDPALVVIQPLMYRLTYSSRHGKCKKEWLDVLFLSKFNTVGLLSLPGRYALELFQCLKILELREIQIHGAWLSLTRRVSETTALFQENRGDKRTYIPHVNSYYWASTWDCVRATRTISDLWSNPWEKAHGQ